MKTLYTVLFLLVAVSVGSAQTFLNLTAVGDIPDISLLASASDGALVYGEFVSGSIGYHSNILISKLSPEGNVRWMRITHYDKVEDQLFLYHMLEASDRSIVMAGSFHKREVGADGNSAYTNYQLLMRSSADGALLSSSGFSSDGPYGKLTQLHDGTISLTGNSNQHAWELGQIAFYDSSLTTEHTIRIVHPNSLTYANAVPFSVECPDTTLIVAASYFDTLVVIHLDRSGRVFSSVAASFPQFSHFTASGIARGADGSIMVAGLISKTTAQGISCLIAIDTSGVIRRVISIDPLVSSGGCSLTTLPTGEFVVTTVSHSFAAHPHYFLIDKDLVIRRAVTADALSGLMVRTQIATAKDGSIIIAGTATKNSNLDTIHAFWGTLLPTLDGCHLSDELVIAANESFLLDSSFAITIDTFSQVATPIPLALDPYVFTTTVTSICEATSEVRPELAPLDIRINSPIKRSTPIIIRPAVSITGTYHLSIRDVLGKNIYSEEKSIDAEELRIPSAGLSGGIYFIELQDPDSFATLWRGKVVVE